MTELQCVNQAILINILFYALMCVKVHQQNDLASLSDPVLQYLHVCDNQTFKTSLRDFELLFCSDELREMDNMYQAWTDRIPPYYVNISDRRNFRAITVAHMMQHFAARSYNNSGLSNGFNNIVDSFTNDTTIAIMHQRRNGMLKIIKYLKEVHMYQEYEDFFLYFFQSMFPSRTHYKLLTQINSYNITFVKLLGEGTYGFVYEVIYENQPYAFKLFTHWDSGCHREENLMIALQDIPIQTAHLVYNDVFNCDNINGFMMELIIGVSIEKVTGQILKHHPGQLFGFIADLRDTLMNITATVKQRGLRIAHTDITEKNVLYNNETKLFYLIDWGMGTDFDLCLWPFSYGSWHVFSPYGYLLRTRVQNRFVKGPQSEIDWSYGHMNDLYSIHCVVLDFLAFWQNGQVPHHLKHSLCVARHTAVMNAQRIEHRRSPYQEYWTQIYPILYTTWDVRARQLKQYKSTNFTVDILNDIIQDAIKAIDTNWVCPGRPLYRGDFLTI